jgi:galactose mutarotase-like enzyme
VRIQSGHEFLLQPQRSLRRAAYGDSFGAYDTSGFDECMPTVSACTDPNRGVSLPDHGELWSVPWQAEVHEDALQLSATGRVLPYRFTRRTKLDGSGVVLDYEITNESETEMKFLWSAHPLLSVEPGSRITLPAEVAELLVQYSLGNRLGSFGSTCQWPRANAGSVKQRLDVLLPPTARFADKLFTPRLRDGYCSLFKPAANETITFRFDVEPVPYIGLWCCQGGWPDPAHGHYTIALEPCSGRPDSLREAIAGGENDVLPAGSSKRWSLRIELTAGDTANERGSG